MVLNRAGSSGRNRNRCAGGKQMRDKKRPCASLLKAYATAAFSVIAAAAACLTTPSSAEAANSPALRLIKLIPINGTAANRNTQINSFDISWFDASTGLYYLADRSNAAIDVVDTTGAFTGTPYTLLGPLEHYGV